MRIEIENEDYKQATRAVERVLDSINIDEDAKKEVLSYAGECVDAVWDAIKP